MKFALVEWIHSNSTSIISTRGIRNKAMISNPNLIDKVEIVQDTKIMPPSGWPAYDAKVLAVADKKSELKEKEQEWLQEDDGSSCKNGSVEETGRGKRSRKPKVSSLDALEQIVDSKTQKTATQVARKLKQLQKKARIVESAEVLDSLGEEFKKSDCADKSGTLQTENMNDTLLAENVKLKHEVSHLKELVTNLQTDLPHIVKELNNAVTILTSISRSELHLTSTAFSDKVPSTPKAGSVETTSIFGSPGTTTPRIGRHLLNMKQATCTISSTPYTDNNAELTECVLQSEEKSVDNLIKMKWHIIRKDEYRKMTRDLMEVVFAPDEMAMCSLTGGKGHTGSTKTALDQMKIDSIISKVKEQHPSANVLLIKQTMTNKLQDVAKRFKRNTDRQPAAGNENAVNPQSPVQSENDDDF